ncbi:DUF4124 domain-containing protein [Pseudomonas sp. KFB-139]|uniref:DUF4124 domain-containing protein n=1 Tax=Pseudomonas serbiensis TaxID=3064350 RepID=A0ABT9CNL8_9PSED|nr:DUF4124 domain-containing protein [Pseudomonas sp. KFB-138]MDO7927086.1 DUF4124 domain-containing protein [Pseudomonas sp. KFB-138]
MRLCLVCLLLMISWPAAAQIYKYTDANGNTAYSNQPPDGTKAEAVVLPPLNSVDTLPAPRNPAPVQQERQASQQPAVAYQTLELTDLPTDEALRANNGTFTIGVQIQPRLQSGHRLQLLVDGNPYGTPTNIPRLQVVNIDRGEHSFAVVVLDSQRIIQQSPTQTLTVQRVHVNGP